MKFGNKKQIQKLYREQIRNKREKEISFIEMIFMILMVAVLIFINHYYMG
ncbi:MAG TPA: hypothetical protein VNU45_05810 [Rummeliibacillus sp.]|nr:hypothetical protein [Rummeliibacillus sp.]